ncbi:hypothetical protein [Thalassobellus suaedae]|uniref:Uncharacterized protein n=1 Tax=Thalassobellus suaedae TaxID=3074124 RepID=A0ABY9XVW9_9FLAO|nr:hypothetical protein RHP51_05255 [Flavobacteriaceae bacterium HL-DH14]
METHIAIYISNNDDKHKLLESIQTKALVGNLTNLKGALFSEIALNKFILEETRHGHFDVTTQTKNSLKNSSQGERKKYFIKPYYSEKSRIHYC